MKSRLIGLETEYAIRFSSSERARPDNRVLYDLITKTFSEFTRTAEGTSILKWKQIFTENGSAFCYESLPHHLESGLLEAATPECETPFQLLLYQKAIDELLKKTLLRLNSQSHSFPDSKISLIKNCKDAYGNIYGAQENYSAILGNRWELLLYRIFLFFYLPLLSIYIVNVFLLSFFILLIQSIILILFYFFYLIFLSFHPKGKWNSYEFFLYPDHKNLFSYFEKISGKILTLTEITLSLPMILPYVYVLKFLTFRKYKKLLLSFLITRIIFTGSGSIEENGKFYLSEKATRTKRVSRNTNFPADRCIFDPGNLMKLSYLGVLSLFKLEFLHIKQLFNKEQRLQIGMSDSCMSSEAELLKIGIIPILLNMIDENFLKETPQIQYPIKSLKKINTFPNYNIPLRIRKTKNIPYNTMTPLEIQEWYLKKTKEYLKSQKIVQPEYPIIIQLWEEILSFLKENPVSLFGRIDWITKKILMNQVIKAETQKQEISFFFQTEDLYKRYYKNLKILDIKYHDLLDGYYQELEKAGFTKKLFTQEEIEKAIHNPPLTHKGYAWLRSKIIKKINQSFENVKISWDHIKIGSGTASKIIRLSDYKK